MNPYTCSILTLVPYRILPPVSGGQLSIAHLHHYLGLICTNNLAGTKDNDINHKFGFQLHPVFPASRGRYIPYSHIEKLVSIGKSYDASAIICEHPYMAITAMALAKKLHIPWYLRSQNIESMRFKDLGKPWWKLLATYERYAMQKADGVLFITAEDADWAHHHYRIHPQKSFVVPFGTPLEKRPDYDIAAAKKAFAEGTDLDVSKKWLYFLGVLDYEPNSDAVLFILEHIIPELNLEHSDFEILIAGKGLPEHLKKQIDKTPGIRYLGFVPDLDLFLKACDIMLNPILSGGGIKTKLVEALAYNKLVVSTVSGAAGINPEVCGKNMKVMPDKQWKSFTEAIQTIAGETPNVPDGFYDMYYWGNIAKKVVRIMAAPHAPAPLKTN